MAWLILDASVVTASFLHDEMHADQAYRLLVAALSAPGGLDVPSICWTEVAHSLVRAFRRGRIAETALDNTAATLHELAALVPGRDVDPAQAMGLARGIGLGVYDATYLVLAREIGLPLVTLDRRQFEVGSAAGLDVAWLPDLPLA